MKEKIIIYGAGETAELAYEYFTYDSNYEVAGFAVDAEYKTTSDLKSLKVIDIENINVLYPHEDYKAFVAISSIKMNRNRQQAYEKLKAKGYTLVSYVSSKAFVWHNVKIGENCFILENNVLQPFTWIGDNVTMWSGNHVGHRSKIGNHCFISSHCVISGFCEIGDSSFLGVNCTIEDGVKIGPDNFLGASSLVQKNTERQSLYQEVATELSKVNTHRLFRIKQ